MDLQFSILLVVIALCSASVLFPKEETHVITCFQRISEQYFTTLNKFIILLPDVEKTSPHEDRYFLNTNSPTTTTDLAQSLLREINGLSKLVFVIQPDILVVKNITTWLEVPEPVYTNDVLIVIFTKINLKTVLSQFIHSKPDLIVILIFTPFYTELEEEVIIMCLELFAKGKLFNVLILIPHTNIDKSKKAEVESLYIYSLYPNYPIKNCGVIDNRLNINVWFLDGEGSFLDSTEFFPEVVSSGFKGCQISVRSSELETFGFMTFLDNIGLMYLRLAAKAIGMKLKVYNEDEIPSTDIDLFMEVMSLNSLNFFSTEVPTYIFREIKMKWHVPCPKPISRHGNFIRVFSNTIWLQLFLIAILFGLVIYWHYKSSNYSNSALDLSSTFLKIWSILTGVSTEVGTDNYKIRLGFFIWTLFCLIISTVFQAFFTGFLIEPGMYAPISKLEELNSTGITRAIPLREYIYILYTLSENDALDISNSVCTITGCWYGCVYWNNFSFLADNFLTGITARAFGFQSCTLDDNAITMYATFYIPRSSYFFKIINQLIIRIAESGIPVFFESYYAKEMDSMLGPIMKLDQGETDDYFIFGMRHLKLIFYSLGIGYLIGFVVFVFEMFHYKLCFLKFKNSYLCIKYAKLDVSGRVCVFVRGISRVQNTQ
ncbi:Ionotropic receptor 689 [Blattella germanica]|nr:Ionotropic receptor 689 [Blattella germanica]